MKKTALILFSMIVLIFPLFIKLRRGKESSISEKLQILSSDEQKCLEFFFRDSFAFDSLGYTLFGDKPMTATGYSYYDPKERYRDIDDFFDSTFDDFSSENLRKRRGYEILKKYQSLFLIKNYGIVQCKNFIDNNHTTVLFINKPAFLATVRNHLTDFRKILGNQITPETLLSQILVSNDVFGDVLKNHQGLIGTLLGYGRHNAWLFQEREELDPWMLKKRFSLKKQTNHASQNKIDKLNAKLLQLDTSICDFNPLLLRLPRFVADPDAKETQELKVNYKKQYRKILSSYQKGDFLETTLEQLSSVR